MCMSTPESGALNSDAPYRAQKLPQCLGRHSGFGSDVLAGATIGLSLARLQCFIDLRSQRAISASTQSAPRAAAWFRFEASRQLLELGRREPLEVLVEVLRTGARLAVDLANDGGVPIREHVHELSPATGPGHNAPQPSRTDARTDRLSSRHVLAREATFRDGRDTRLPPAFGDLAT